MKMPEPKAWIKYLIGAEAKPNGQCYDIVFTPVDGYSPLYDKQALRDLLEAAIEVDWTEVMREGQLVTWGDAGTLGYRVVEKLRSMKEKL
jgi:hypothetical protein